MKIISKNQAGLTLIEVLIASSLLLIGIVGQLSTQSHSINSSRLGLNISKASHIIYDIAERMKNNKQGVIKGYYDAYGESSKIIAGDATEISLPYCPCDDSEDQSTLDLAHWEKMLLQLPTGIDANGDKKMDYASGSIEPVTSNSPSLVTYKITVAWPEKRFSTIGANETAMRKKSIVVAFDTTI